MGGSVALLLMGTFIFVDSFVALIKGEHPTIGAFNFFGKEVWLGWLMIVVLLYGFVPALILGRRKAALCEIPAYQIAARERVVIFIEDGPRPLTIGMTGFYPKPVVLFSISSMITLLSGLVSPALS